MQEMIAALVLLLLPVLVGFCAGRLTSIPIRYERWLQMFVFRVAMPLIIIRAIVAAPDLGRDLLIAGVAPYAAGLMVTVSLAIFWSTRLEQPDEGHIHAALPIIYGNTAALGIPMLDALFGETGVVIAVVAGLCNIAMLLSYLLIVRIRDHAVVLPRLLLRILGTPIFMATILAFTLRALELPGMFATLDWLRAIGKFMVPLILFSGGLSISRCKAVETFRQHIWISSLKCLLQPVVTLIAALFVAGYYSPYLVPLVLIAAMPIAPNLLPVMAYERGDVEMASSAVVVSNAGALVLLPSWFLLFSFLAD